MDNHKTMIIFGEMCAFKKKNFLTKELIPNSIICKIYRSWTI